MHWEKSVSLYNSETKIVIYGVFGQCQKVCFLIDTNCLFTDVDKRRTYPIKQFQQRV